MIISLTKLEIVLNDAHVPLTIAKNKSRVENGSFPLKTSCRIISAPCGSSPCVAFVVSGVASRARRVTIFSTYTT